jgi:CDP-glycerol glycerophosphotransferase (TagB/SpsB family)
VWGQFWKDFLVSKGNYPEGSVVVTGQIRTDIIPSLKDIQRLKAKLRPFPEKFIVAFASQPQRDPVLRERTAYDVYKGMSSIHGAILVQKLHPGEKDDFRYYREIARKAGLEEVIIESGIELYSLIASCDLLVTSFSTVGTETVYFNKPLIIYDPLMQDIQHYLREGVAFRATCAEEICDLISRFKEGRLAPDLVAYRDYCSRYVLKIDGKSALRCLEEIRRSP